MTHRRVESYRAVRSPFTAFIYKHGAWFIPLCGTILGAILTAVVLALGFSAYTALAVTFTLCFALGLYLGSL